MAVNSFIAALGNILEGASSDRERTRKLKELEEDRAREEARNARIELRQQQQDARALAMDEIQLRQYGATVVDPNIASGKAQRDVTRGMGIAQDIMGSQSAISTPQPEQSPAKTARLGLTLAPVGLPSKYDPQEQLSKILKGKQADRSAMDETMQNSVQLGGSRYSVPSTAQQQAALTEAADKRAALLRATLRTEAEPGISDERAYEDRKTQAANAFTKGENERNRASQMNRDVASQNIDIRRSVELVTEALMKGQSIPGTNLHTGGLPPAEARAQALSIVTERVGPDALLRATGAKAPPLPSLVAKPSITKDQAAYLLSDKAGSNRLTQAQLDAQYRVTP